ncbi:MAG: amino acid adenylation domain-containing protein [Cyanobacteria bacterium P01_D01_bin.156]
MSLENVADIYPLSPVQEGMLFHALNAPKSGVYIEQYACKLQGTLKINEFQQAWQQVIARQPVLRTAFLWEGLDEPLQVVRQQVDVSWTMDDWQGQSSVEQEQALAELLAWDRTQDFDLLQAPISRFRLIHLRDNSHQFIWSFHHILADGWSIPIIWQEVLSCYAANCHQQTPVLSPLYPYRDYIAWLTEQDLSNAETFWRSHLKGFTEPTPLPAGRASLGKQPYQQQTLTLSPDLYAQLQSFCRQHRLTLNTVLQGAWALLLHHYSSQNDIVYGSVVSGRPAELKGIETMVGLFINTLPVRVAVATDQDLVFWLQGLQQKLLDLRQYETTPLSDVQRWSDIPQGSPLFESIVVFENYPTAKNNDLDLDIQDIRYLEQSNYPLALLVLPGNALELFLLYDPARFESGAISRLHTHLELLLTAFVEKSDRQLADLPRLTAAEQQQLTDWEILDYPKELTIQQLIADQVRKTPEAPAVVFEGQTLTYGELAQQAETLAYWLQGHGVGVNDRVALCLKPSLDRIVAILAVLKAGGAYVPLDPSYPAERIIYCLEDTAPKFLITQRSVTLPEISVNCVYLDDLEQVEDQGQDRWQARDLPQHEDLAYIIYTSGSTGKPKGVMVSQGNLVHSTLARTQVYPNPVGRFLLLSSIAFDSSVAGIFWTLCQGGTLVLPPERIEQDLQQLANLIDTQSITHTLCVPTLYSLLLDAVVPEQLSTLQTVIVAGEACSPNLVKQHYDKLSTTDLYNEYGPTEATVWCTVHRIPATPAPGPVPIGQVIPNAQIYLLDEELQPVPTGAVGEIYVGGAGVTQGYLNQPDKTAAAFVVPDGGHGLPAERLYKTGDLGRYRADGALEWLGRCDRQVKIRGYRIELGEIEDVLRAHSAVQETTVVARPANTRIEDLVEALSELEPQQAEDLLAAVEGGS